MMDVVMRGGLIVYPGREVQPGDIGIKDGRIAAIVAPGAPLSGTETIDCTDHLIMPGLIDPHAHFGFGSPERDFYTESRSAAIGGVTTVLSFYRADDFLASFPTERERAGQLSAIDYGYHFGITSRHHVESMAACLDAFGVSSFKFYLMYKGKAGHTKGFTDIDDGLLYLAMEQVATMPGAVLGVHCENVEVVPFLRERLQQAGRDDLAAWDEQSPDFLEAENVHRVCYFARRTDCPVNLVHISSAEAMAEARRHRHLDGSPVYIETCPHYLTLTTDADCGVLGKVNPPLRRAADVDALWEAVVDGTVDTIGADHVPRKKRTKDGGIWKASNGFPGIATMLPLLLHEGYHRRNVPIETIAALTSANVARLYNIPCKGDIAVGMDADLIVVNPELEQTVQWTTLESYSDYTPYEGKRLKGWPVLTMLRGQVIARSGKVTAEPGFGRYVSRRPKKG